MLISLNWLKDFVAVPSGTDPRELALGFTITAAEVDGIEHHEANFSGLVAAKIDRVERVPGEAKLQKVTLTADKQYATLSAAPDLMAGSLVIYGPPGAKVAGHTFGTTDPAGRPSEGMIVAGQALGLVQVGANAIFLPPSTKPGAPIDPAFFDDWIIEIDNKSITHRPDCWGHYGIAREVAAMLDLPLKKYDVTDLGELPTDNLPEIPIEIDDPAKCPRYTGLLMRGLAAQPSPLWMQARLALCGQRPIDLLVDLTNYIMMELGQPMHAFDGARLTNIQVATAAPKEKFTTLDGVTRTMPDGALMIQCDRKSVAIAGIMGGAETEVSAKTQTVLLESANFDAATIRRAATAMGHRTEASARFEKSLDPANTVLGIARFHRLASAELPDLQVASALSDCYPAPKKPPTIELDCAFAARFIGKPVTPDEICRILTKLEFTCRRNGAKLLVTPPTYRATKDIAIEADLIEEVARFVGYNNIDPVLPTVAARYYEPSAELTLEQRTLDYFCIGGDFVEVHDYIWYDDDWVRTLGFEPGECITLRNPAADNCSRLRHSLTPGLLAMADRNRHHYERFNLIEIGSVFFPGIKEVEKSQRRHMALLVAQSGAKADGAVWDRLRSALSGWAMQVLEGGIDFAEATSAKPWEDETRIAEVRTGDRTIGRATILPLACKQKIDERLRAVSMALCEIDLSAVVDLLGRHEKLPALPKFPRVRLDFSTLCDAGRRYEAVKQELAKYSHAQLRRVEFVDAYQGGSIPQGKRSLTFRAEIGKDDGTLSEDDIRAFQDSFKKHLSAIGLELRS
jgi:phenylalanyl-tRNA synthetase beta chain